MADPDRCPWRGWGSTANAFRCPGRGRVSIDDTVWCPRIGGDSVATLTMVPGKRGQCGQHSSKSQERRESVDNTALGPGRGGDYSVDTT